MPENPFKLTPEELAALDELDQPEQTQKSESAEVQILKSKALAGDPEAQYKLAICYETGDGVDERDYKKAAELYQMAADQNHPQALCNLAESYENGAGIPQDSGKAFQLYLKAAILGCEDALQEILEEIDDATIDIPSYYMATRGMPREYKKQMTAAECFWMHTKIMMDMRFWKNDSVERGYVTAQLEGQRKLMEQRGKEVAIDIKRAGIIITFGDKSRIFLPVPQLMPQEPDSQITAPKPKDEKLITTAELFWISGQSILDDRRQTNDMQENAIIELYVQRRLIVMKCKEMRAEPKFDRNGIGMVFTFRDNSQILLPSPQLMPSLPGARRKIKSLTTNAPHVPAT